MVEYTKCNYCSRDESTTLFREGGLNIVRCDCGLIYTNPRLTESELNKLYSTFNVSFDRSVMRSWIKIANKRIREIKKFKKRGSLLEIGCSLGYFLRGAKASGYEPYGIDVSTGAIKIAKREFGLKNVWCKTLEDFNTKQKFDIIAMYHVLEHTRDPMRTIKKIKTLLKKDGLFVIEVPDVNSLKAKLLKSKWIAYDFNLHLYYFSYKTLKNFMAANGFEIIKTKKIPNILLNQFGGKATKTVSSLPPKAKSMLSDCHRLLTFALGKASIGDSIQIYCKLK